MSPSAWLGIGGVGLLAACTPPVEGGAGSGGAAATTSSTTTTSTTTTTSSTTSTLTTTSSGTTTSGTCPSTCSEDAECAACPAGYLQASCCDAANGACYAASQPTCPGSCEQGHSCSTSFCTADPASCASSCTCGADGHFACTMKADLPACPSPHAVCGAACDPLAYAGTACLCTPDGGPPAVPCGCDATSATWTCWPPLDPAFPCPPLGKVVRGTRCEDFPLGLTCNLGECTCTAGCGTQTWFCGVGP